MHTFPSRRLTVAAISIAIRPTDGKSLLFYSDIPVALSRRGRRGGRGADLSAMNLVRQ